MRRSASLVERKNRTLRAGQRRFTRKTEGFSKKLRNHHLSVTLHLFVYNFVRPHGSLKRTPGEAAGLIDEPLKLDLLLERMDY